MYQYYLLKIQFQQITFSQKYINMHSISNITYIQLNISFTVNDDNYSIHPHKIVGDELANSMGCVAHTLFHLYFSLVPLFHLDWQ